MKISDQLKQKRAAHLDALQQLVDAAENRALTAEEREKTKQLRGQLETLTAQIEAAEAQEASEARAAAQQAGNTGARKAAREMGEAVKDVRSAGGKRRVAIDPETVFRAVMTPASNSAGKSAYMGTSGVQQQNTEDIGWMNLLSIVTAERNGQRFPFITRAGRTTPETKAYTDSTAEQAFTVDSFTVELSNYYTRLAIHNDVLRDAAVEGLEQTIFDAAKMDIQRQVAYHILYGGGGNALTGITGTSGIQTVAGGSAAVADYTKITEALEKLMSGANVRPENVAVLMHPKVWRQFADLQDTTDQPLMRPKELENIPFVPYNRIPTDQGAGTDETTIFVVDLSQWVLFGEGYYEIASDSGPNMSKDYTDILLTFRCDLATIDPASAVVITAVKSEA